MPQKGMKVDVCLFGLQIVELLGQEKGWSRRQQRKELLKAQEFLSTFSVQHVPATAPTL